jgi:hypothetical protein
MRRFVALVTPSPGTPVSEAALSVTPVGDGGGNVSTLNVNAVTVAECGLNSFPVSWCEPSLNAFVSKMQTCE